MTQNAKKNYTNFLKQKIKLLKLKASKKKLNQLWQDFLFKGKSSISEVDYKHKESAYGQLKK